MPASPNLAVGSLSPAPLDHLAPLLPEPLVLGRPGLVPERGNRPQKTFLVTISYRCQHKLLQIGFLLLDSLMSSLCAHHLALFRRRGLQSPRTEHRIAGLQSLCEDSAFFRFYMNIVNDRLRSLDDAQPLLGAPHPRQVVGGGGQGPFDGYFSKSSHAKPPHAALLLQHSVHRLDQRFASRVNFRARRVAQFPAHPPLRR